MTWSIPDHSPQVKCEVPTPRYLCKARKNLPRDHVVAGSQFSWNLLGVSLVSPFFHLVSYFHPLAVSRQFGIIFEKATFIVKTSGLAKVSRK